MNENPQKENNRKYQTILLPILAVITVIAVIAAVLTMKKAEPDKLLTPDVAPQQTESNAEALPPDDRETEPTQEGGGSVSLTFSKKVEISLQNRTAALVFANPGRSNQDMVLQLLIQDEVIFQSNLLKPGNMLRKMDMLEGKEKILSAGTYEGCFNVLYYDPVSGERAVVNTEIPVEVTVK